MAASPPDSTESKRRIWSLRQETLLAAGAAVAGLAGLAMILDVTAFERATIPATLAGSIALGISALRRREQRLLAEAELAVSHIGAPEPGESLPCNPGSNAFAAFAHRLNSAADSIALREARFALLAKATGDAVWDWDLQTDIIACTHGGLAVLGAGADAFVQPFSWWQERVHPDERESLEASLTAMRSSADDQWSQEYRFLHSDGGYRWMWDRGVVVRDGAGGAVRIVGCMTDISARKEAEEMLLHAERRQRALITAVSSIVWRDDLMAAVQPRNLAWEEYTGQTQEEEYGEGWLDAVHPDDRQSILEAWSTAMKQGSVYQTDLRLRRRDGTYRWMSARGAPVSDKAGRIVEYIGLYEDIEDHCAAREALRGKTAELGERVKELRCLHAISIACNREEAEVAEILTGIALVLPTALMHPAAAVCAVNWNGTSFTSPDYIPPAATLRAALEPDGYVCGEIILGYTSRLDFLAEEEQLLETAAKVVSQMLARRGDRDRLRRQSQELWRRQAMSEQTEQLAKVGGWEYDIAAGAVTWSPEVRRIAATDAESQELSSTFLQESLEETLRTGESFDRELAWTLPNGTTKWLHTLGQVEVIDGRPVRIFGIVKDVTEEKEAHSRVWHMANHDALTGLPNRRFFQAKLEAALSASDAAEALLLIDLDHFKEVNDTLGHDAGDALLRAVAERLGEAAGQRATVARLGGDEFAVLARAAHRAEACELAQHLLSHLRQPICLAGQMTSIGFSAGLAVSPEDATSSEDLLKNADIALYYGKSRGRSAFVTYAPHMREGLERRIALCSEVRGGLDRDQFLPFYQPKICLRTGTVKGFEALIRWNHPAGLRSPAALMAAFDDQELALGLGKRMLERIIADMQAWRRNGLDFGHVALNASAAEFAGFDLADHVLGQLAEAGLPTALLSLEVTETVLLGREGEAVGPTLRRLHDAGVCIALDDFGTGYASLTHLQQYPVDIIKIDQSFIRSIDTDLGSQAITSAMLALGRNLGMIVIAEGVETAEHAHLLRIAGCDQAQGYYFARPMPSTDVPAFLRSWRGDAIPEAVPRERNAA